MNWFVQKPELTIFDSTQTGLAENLICAYISKRGLGDPGGDFISNGIKKLTRNVTLDNDLNGLPPIMFPLKGTLKDK